MTFADLLATVIGLLDTASIPYMVSGSMASSYHGVPRTTRDIDIVIDPDAGSLRALVVGLTGAGFSVDGDVALAALASRSQFNAIGPDVTKVDFIIRRDRPFSIEEFGRRQQADLLGTRGFVVTAEDLVIAKLEWAAASGSERQLEDVAGMLAIARDVDLAYIERWVEALGLQAAWRRVRPETGD